MITLITAAVVLLLLEIILGVDNVIFVSILSEKLPLEKQRRARNVGMSIAMVIRLALLACIGWIISLEAPMDYLWGLSWKGVILILGGLFLGYSSIKEIYEASEGGHVESHKKATVNFRKTIISIVGVSILFSIDSILTAVGMTESIVVMAIGIIGSTIVMMIFAKKISDFIAKHKSLKMLALSFLLMISLFLVLEAVHIEVPKGYVYAAMGFGLFVETINIRIGRNRNKPIIENKYKKKESTGLETKDKVKLFEGDVIKIAVNLVGKIVYEPEMAGFLIEFDSFKSRYQNTFRLNCDVVYFAEKLGSIHESPELKDELTGFDYKDKPETFEFH